MPGWSLLLFAATLVVLLVLIGAGGGYFFPEQTKFVRLMLASPRGLLVGMGVIFAIAGLAAALAVAPLGRSALPALGFRSAPWKYLLLAPIATLALSIGVSQFGLKAESMDQVLEVVKGPNMLLLGLIPIGLLAPVAEELIFRGLIYGWVAGRWGSIAAWIVSTIAFAGAHLEIAHIVMVLPLAILFGWLRRRTDSLWPTIVAHIANNSFALVAAVLLDI